MRFIIREKFFSFKDDFTIKDASENDRFQVQGKFFSLGDKLKLLDMDGNELIYIEQQLFRLMPEYYLSIQGNMVAKIKKRFNLFKPKFVVESSYGDYEIQGDFFHYNFTILKDGDVVATISKKFFSFADYYGADIVDTENYPFILAMIIVVDQVLHDEKNNHNH